MRLLGPRWRWVRRSAVVVVAVVLIMLACWPELPYCVLGWLRNESFFEGRPTSLWRNDLRNWCHQPARPPARPFALSYLTAIFGSGIASKPAIIHGGPRSLPVLLELLDDPDPKVRCAAISHLADFGLFAEPAVPFLTRALDDQDRDVRIYAARSLLAINKARPKRILVQMVLTAQETAQQDQITFWLAEVANQDLQAAAALQELCRCPVKSARQSAIDQLRSINTDLAKPLLREWLRSSDNERRRQAISYLTMSGSNSFFPLSAAEVLPIMLEWFNDSDDEWRIQTIEWLGAFGPAAVDALPSLELILRNRNDRDYESAWNSVNEIDPKVASQFPPPQN